MSNNVKIQISADTADLTVKAAIAKASITELNRTVVQAAREMLAGDTTPELRSRALAAADAMVQEKVAAAGIARQLRELSESQAVASGASRNYASAQSASAVSSGQMKFAMRDLSYQISDVSTMWAMGAKPMQIFASQSGQVIGALQLMAGEAKGVLGFLGGPWGMILTSASVALAPLIGKLFETKDAANSAEDALRSASDAARELAGTQNALKLNQKRMDLNKISEERMTLEGRVKVLPYGNDPNAAMFSPNSYQGGAKRRIQELKWQQVQAENEIKLAEDINAETQAKMDAAARRSGRPTHSSGGEHSSRGGGSASARSDNGEAAAQEELQERQAVNRQEEALAEDKARTEIALSKSALQAKLADIDAEQRAGQISKTQAIQQRADLNQQIAKLDQDQENTLFEAKRKELQADRENYKDGSQQYREYTRQIELLTQQHQNRVRVMKSSAAAQQKQANRQAIADEVAEQQKAEDRKRQIMAQSFQPFAQQLAHMVTLQQGFASTIRNLWGSMVGVVDQVVARIVESWLVGLATKQLASEKAHLNQVFLDAKQAASGAWAATVKIPIIGPILAPIAAATAFAGVMAFSAEGGWDVPDGAGAGVDGRGGRLSVIHPREMVLPAHISDKVRGLTSSGGFPAQIASGVAPGTLAQAVAAPISTFAAGGAFSSRMSQGVDEALKHRLAVADEMPGRARSRSGRDAGINGSSPNINFTVNAIDARGVKRLLEQNQFHVANAVSKAGRHGFRPR